MTNPLFLVVTICGCLLPVYYKTERFDHFWGILLFILAGGAAAVRLVLLRDYPLFAFYREGSVWPPILLLGIPATAVFIYGMYTKRLIQRKNIFLRLLPLYIIFGALQQMFFLWVFTDSVYYLSRDLDLTLAVSVLYFLAVHMTEKSALRPFFPLLFLFYLTDIWAYLYLGNIVPQLVFHGLIGSLFYSIFTDRDEVQSRTGYAGTVPVCAG